MFKELYRIIVSFQSDDWILFSTLVLLFALITAVSEFVKKDCYRKLKNKSEIFSSFENGSSKT